MQDKELLEYQTKLGYYSRNYMKKDGFESLQEQGKAPTENVFFEEGFSSQGTYTFYVRKYPNELSFQDYLLGRQVTLLEESIEVQRKTRNSIIGGFIALAIMFFIRFGF